MAGKREMLEAYIDACALVKETEKDIQKLQKDEAKSGSEKCVGHTFPCGSLHTPPLRREKEILWERMEKAEKARADAEEIIDGASARMQRIIRHRVFEGLSWEMVAAKMGRGATAESVRKEYQRFLS